jgi:hypothetical protein
MKPNSAGLELAGAMAHGSGKTNRSSFTGDANRYLPKRFETRRRHGSNRVTGVD